MKNEVMKVNRELTFYINLIFTLVLLGVLMLYASDSHAVNHLQSLKKDVADTFGGSSDVPYYLLLGEGVIGAIAYMKTKNIMVLAGVPVLMIFTHFALS